MAETDDQPTAGADRPVDRPVDRPADRPAGPARRDTPESAGDGASDPVRETRSDDDRDIGWGDDLDRADRGGERDARWYEEQRPPHWE